MKAEERKKEGNKRRGGINKEEQIFFSSSAVAIQDDEGAGGTERVIELNDGFAHEWMESRGIELKRKKEKQQQPRIIPLEKHHQINRQTRQHEAGASQGTFIFIPI